LKVGNEREKLLKNFKFTPCSSVSTNVRKKIQRRVINYALWRQVFIKFTRQRRNPIEAINHQAMDIAERVNSPSEVPSITYVSICPASKELSEMSETEELSDLQFFSRAQT
jgi:hypothetical protein